MVQQTREDEDDVFVEKLNNMLFLFLGLLTVFASVIMLVYSATVAFYAQQFTTSFLYTSVFAAVLFVTGVGLLHLWRTRRKRRGREGQVLPISKTRPRISLFLFILLLLTSLNFVPSTNAASKIYKWYSPENQSCFGVYVGVDDSWPTEIAKIVHLKVTLVDKNSTFDHVDIKWTKVEISTAASTMSSGNIPETASFRNTGEYYERKVEFWVPPDTLNRGENASLSIVWSINVDLVDNVEWEHSVYTGSNFDNPMKIELYRPILSTTEWTIIGIAIITAVAGSVGYRIQKRRSGLSS